MKFVPRRARDDVNISAEHPLAEAATLFFGLGLVFALATLLLFFLADLIALVVPASTEARIFSGFTPHGLKPATDEQARAAAALSLVDRLAAHWPESPYEFRVEVMKADAPNALAAPGGLIVVSTGLLEMVESENELAFVLAHELGHFRNRDHIRTLGRGLAAGVLFATLGVGKSATGLGISIADLSLRGFSRGQERHADEFALELVGREYGHVAEAWRFFERLDNEPKLHGNFWIYFSTHPGTLDRIATAKARAQQAGWSLSGAVTPLPWSTLPAGE